MSRYKFINVYDPVHKHYIVISCGDFSKFKQWIERDFKDLTLEEPSKQQKGKYLSNGKFHFIWIKSKTDYGVLMHEIAHAINHFMQMRGIKFDFDNDEPYCYLLEFWFNEIRKNLKKL